MQEHTLPIVTAVIALLALPGFALAHDPYASPLAKVSQRVGPGEIAVEYSSPGVKQRKVWSEVVPPGKLWRTGANASTKITFSKDMTVAGKPVAAGMYSLLTIPGPSTWTVILNRNTAIRGDQGNYKSTEDVLRVSARKTKIPHRERLTFIFSDATDRTVSLDIEWETVRVTVPLELASS